MAQTQINGLQSNQLPTILKPQALPTLTGNQIFVKAKQSVFRLSTRMKGTQSESSHGTAFVVSPNGLIVTNFHVVLPSLESSDKNELILESPTGNIPAVVLMIDSINDLALVKVDYQFATTLPIAETFNLMPGDTIFSLGFPIREELSLIQGLFNGQQSQGVAPFFRASTPLNGGMSGGPTLNSAGEVVAVNRAVLTKAQNISYLSPWTPLRKIVSAGVLMSEKHIGTQVSGTNWKTFVSNQVLGQEKNLFSTNGQSQHGMQKIGEIRFRMPFANMECGQDQFSARVSGKSEFINCENINLSIMSPDIGSLKFKIIAAVVEKTSIFGAPNLVDQIYSSLRIANEKNISLSLRAPASTTLLKEKEKEKCVAKNVVNAHGVQMLVRFCSIALNGFDGIFSTTVKVDISDSSSKLTRFGIVFEGLSIDTTAKFLESFLDSIERLGAV